MKSTIMTGDIVVVSNKKLDMKTNIIKPWPIYTILGQYRPGCRSFDLTNLARFYVVALPTQILHDGSILIDSSVQAIPMDCIKVRIGKHSSLRTNFDETIEKIKSSVCDVDQMLLNDVVPLEDSILIRELIDRVMTIDKFADQFEHVAFRTMDRDTALYVHNALCTCQHSDLEEKFGLTRGENLNLRKRVKIMAGLNNK